MVHNCNEFEMEIIFVSFFNDSHTLRIFPQPQYVLSLKSKEKGSTQTGKKIPVVKECCTTNYRTTGALLVINKTAAKLKCTHKIIIKK